MVFLYAAFCTGISMNCLVSAVAISVKIVDKNNKIHDITKSENSQGLLGIPQAVLLKKDFL